MAAPVVAVVGAGSDADDDLLQAAQAVGEALYAALGLEGAGPDRLLDAMVANPILIERPIVVHQGRAVIARPPERVLEIL